MGAIDVISWTDEGSYGHMLNTIRQFRLTVPHGVPPESVWGCENYALALLGKRVSDISTRRGMLRVDRFGSVQYVCDYLKIHCGSTMNAYRVIGDNAVLSAVLDAQLVRRAEQETS